MQKKKDEAKEAWLDSQKMPTKRYYGDWFGKFEEFTGLTGDEILAKRAVDKAGTWEAKVLGFKNWLLTEKKLSEYSATAYSMAVRGFFSYHRATLEFRPAESKRISEKSRKTEDYKFSRGDLKKLYDVSDLEERYVVTAGKSIGLRAGDFLALTRGDLEPYVSNEPPASIGEINTEKEKIPAYPFIDSDAQPIIKLMLEKLTREGKTKPDDRILDYSQTIQLTRVLKRLVARAGLEVGTKRVRFHCLRKFLCDHLSSHMSESKWKQVVGKKISEGAYVSADELRKDYLRAMEETTFTQKVGDDVQKIAKLEALKLFAKASGYKDEDIAKIAQLRLRKRNLTTDEEIEEIERVLAEKKQKEETCTDGEHCQEIVSEGELAKFLGEGWKLVAALPSGKIVIGR
jgi:integrase